MQGSRWFVACALVAGCWTSKPEAEAPVIGNTAEVVVERDLSGTFWCTLGDEGYEFDQYPCVIKKVRGKQMLAKLQGSQRFRGFVKPRGARSFAFEGELYCPWGDCTEPVQGTFKAMEGGGYQARFQSLRMTVKLMPGDFSAFGGSAYGGDGYGDPFGYTGQRDAGGAAYGGWGYGGGF